MAKDPRETVPGAAGRGPRVIVPDEEEEQVEDIVGEDDPAPPTEPGRSGNGPAF